MTNQIDSMIKEGKFQLKISDIKIRPDPMKFPVENNNLFAVHLPHCSSPYNHSSIATPIIPIISGSASLIELW